MENLWISLISVIIGVIVGFGGAFFIESKKRSLIEEKRFKSNFFDLWIKFGKAPLEISWLISKKIIILILNF